MDENQLNKTIGYGIIIIVAYYLIGTFIPMLTWVVAGLVALRIYQEIDKHKK